MTAPSRRQGFDTPIFIVTRDRLAALRQLVAWLESSGYSRLVLVDNASTYEPLVEFLDRSPHHVVRLAEDLGPLAPWRADLVQQHAEGIRYVVTEADVVPTDECPPDAVAFLSDALDRYPIYVKAGLGLKTDDLPPTYEHAHLVRAFEAQHWWRRLRRNLYQAPVGTTFAVYRPGRIWPSSRPAIRSGAPYLARRMQWYADLRNPSEEDRYVRTHERAEVLSAIDDMRGYVVVPPAPDLMERIRWRLWVSLRNREERPAGW